MWFGHYCLMSLRLSFLICKVGVIISISWGYCEDKYVKGLDKSSSASAAEQHHHHHHIFSAYSKKVRLFSMYLIHINSLNSPQNLIRGLLLNSQGLHLLVQTTEFL